MANKTITITLQAQDQYSAQLDQFSRKVKQAGSDMNKAGQESNMLKRGLDGLNSAVGLLGFSIGAAGILSMVSQLNQAGHEANMAQVTFNSLNGTLEESGRIMSMLRDRTRGMIDDTALQQAFNELSITTGNSADAITEMIGMAQTLGSALGAPEEALSNLGAALRNMSYERLDSLGVSASAVRTRVAELKDAGLEMGEAFTQATLEQMRLSIDRLGPAVDEQVSNIKQIETALQNAAQDAGQQLNTVLETAAGTALDIAHIINGLADGDFSIGVVLNAAVGDSARAFINQLIEAGLITGLAPIDQIQPDQTTATVGAALGGFGQLVPQRAAAPSSFLDNVDPTMYSEALMRMEQEFLLRGGGDILAAYGGSDLPPTSAILDRALNALDQYNQNFGSIPATDDPNFLTAMSPA